MQGIRIKKRILIWAAFTGSCLFQFSCENDPVKVDELFRKKIALEEANGVKGYISQSGKVKACLTAPYMKRYLVDSPYLEFSKTLHVDFYNDTTTIESTLDALYARQMEFQRKVYIRDSVIVINKLKGDTLRTAELWWDQSTEEFYTDKEVKIFQPTGYTYGRYGMRAKQDFSEWWIKGSSGQRVLSDSNTVE